MRKVTVELKGSRYGVEGVQMARLEESASWASRQTYVTTDVSCIYEGAGLC